MVKLFLEKIQQKIPPKILDCVFFNSNDLVIGWDYRNNNSGFEGNLGAVFFYNTDLTTDQVVNNYNTTKSRYGH